MVEVSGVSSDGTGGGEDSDAAGRAFQLPLQAGGTGQDSGLVAALSPVHLRMASVGPSVLHIVHSGTRSGAGRHRKHARPPHANGSDDHAVEERLAGHVRYVACPVAGQRGTATDTARVRVPRPASPHSARRYVLEPAVAGCDDHRVWSRSTAVAPRNHGDMPHTGRSYSVRQGSGIHQNHGGLQS